MTTKLLLTNQGPSATMTRDDIRIAIAAELTEIETRLTQSLKAHKGGIGAMRAEMEQAEQEARCLSAALDNPTCRGYGHIGFAD